MVAIKCGRVGAGLLCVLACLPCGPDAAHGQVFTYPNPNTELSRPFEIKRTALTQADAMRARLQLRLQELELYTQQTKDPAVCRAAAREFLDISIRHESQVPDHADRRAARWRELPKMGRKLLESGSQDPLVLSHLATALLNAGELPEASQHAERAVELYGKSNYPPHWKLLVLLRRQQLLHRIGHTGRIRDGDVQLYESCGDWMAALGSDRAAAPEAWEVYYKAFSTCVFRWQFARKLVKSLETNDTVDPWLQEMAQGVFHLSAALEPSRNKDPDKHMAEHFTASARHLRKAHELRPNVPHAATIMITVAVYGVDQDSLRDWFDRAIAVRYDFLPAYRNLLACAHRGIENRRELLLHIGRTCANSGMYDTDIPYVLMEAAIQMKGGDTWDFILELDLYDEFNRMLRGLADHPSRANPDGSLSTESAYYLSLLAGIAVRTDRLKEAAKLLRQLGDRANETALTILGVHADFDLAGVAPYAQFEEELKDLRSFTTPPRTRPDNAVLMRTMFESLLRRNRDPRALPWLEHWAETFRMEVDFHEGKWVDLRFNPKLTHWVGDHRNWTVESENSVRGNCLGNGNELVLYHACQFPGPKEITCEVEMLRKASPYMIQGVFVGHLKHVFDFDTKMGRFFWVDHGLKSAGVSGFEKPHGIKAVRATKVHIKAWGPEHFDFYFDGRCYEKQHQDELFDMSSHQIGIGLMYWISMAGEVRFKNIRIRKLDHESPPEVTTASAAKCVEYFTAAIERDPEIYDHYFKRGLAKYLQAETKSQARQDLEFAHKKMPELTSAGTFLGSWYISHDNYADASRVLEQVVRLPGDVRYAEGLLAQLLACCPEDRYRNGQRALDLAQHAIKYWEKPPYHIRLALAGAHAELGQWDAAMREARKLDNYPLQSEHISRVQRLKDDIRNRRPHRMQPSP